MSTLYESRWAATPPADERPPMDKETTGLSASRWTATPPAPDTTAKQATPGLSSSRWADTPSPVEETAKGDERVERGERVEESVNGSVASKSDESGAEVAESGNADAALEEGAIQEKTSDPSSGIDGEEQAVALETEQQANGYPAEGIIHHATQFDSEIKAPEVVLNESKTAPQPDEERSIAPISPTKLRLDVPRLRKKVSWKGKNCIIQIPNLDYNSVGIFPLSLEEVKDRLRRFEEEGYDVKGFDLFAEVANDDDPVHVKPIYPDEAEAGILSVRQGANVKLPDLQTWRDYTDWLTEQKLAALGVGLSSDEPVSAGAQDMSRTSSNQFSSLPPFSPPIPSLSASSAGRPGMPRGHSHTMSVAAPAMSPVNSPFGHMHRHSTFTGPIGFHVQQPTQPHLQGMRNMSALGQQAGVPGMQPFAPSNQFAMPNLNQSSSPAQVINLRNDLGAARSPGSPLNQQMLPQSPYDLNRTISGEQARSPVGYFPSFQHAQKPSPLSPFNANVQAPQGLPQLPEEDDEEELREESEPEAASEPPVETLTYVPPHKRAQINENIAIPTPRGHRHNISEGLERDILEAEKRRAVDRQSWIEVEESGEEPQSTDDSARSAISDQRPPIPAPAAERDPLSQDLVVQETTTHNRKKSTAPRFNVTAPTFRFNPGATFQPASTAFNFSAPAPKPNVQPSFGHNGQQSSGNFNVAAPVFQPSGSSAFSSVPQGEFSFSSKGPVFKPGAPSFQPSTHHDHKNSIFGKVEIPDIVKPARRSKALEIKHPEETPGKSGSSSEYYEDEEGRIAQSEDRMKRQRKFGDDGDEVPQFATPTPMPPPTGLILQSQLADASEEDGEVGEAPMARAVKPEDVLTPPDSSKSVEPERQAPLRAHKHSSSLSALAKPFAPSDVENIARHMARDSYASISELEDGELEDDGLPPTSPFKASEPSPLSEQNGRGFTPTMQEAPPILDQPPSARVNDFTLAEPSYDEIDAVMRQLNEMDDEHEAKQVPDISPLDTPDAHPMEGVTYLPEWTRSDAPSPSPGRQPQPLNPQQDSSFTIHERTDSGEHVLNGWPEPTRLNKDDDAPLSDWSGDFSVDDEEKLQQRGQFFDSHIEDLIGRAVEKRLQPLEESLRSIHTSVNKRPVSRDLPTKRSSSAIESDADDEDEMSEEQRQRPISRGKEKRMDQIKAAVLEALREQGPAQSSDGAQHISELHQVLHDMKMSFARAASNSLELEDVRAVVEDIVGKQSQAMVPIAMDEGNREVEHRREMSELERRLNETLATALEEANLRHSVQEREAETRRMLRLAEEELQLLRDSGRDGDSRLNAAEQAREDLLARLEAAEDAKRDMEEHVRNLENESEATHATLEEYRVSSHKWRQELDTATEQEREDLLARLEKAEDAKSDMEDKVRDLEAESEAMNATLEEYRMSSHKWRQDIDAANREREDLENTINGLERELEESQELGRSMRKRLEKLHSDMAAAAGQLASDKASMKAREEEYRTRCEHLETQHQTHLNERSQLEEELQTLRSGATEASETQQSKHVQERSLLEEEIDSLRANAHEAAESKVALEQMRVTNSSLEEMVRNLQMELVEQQSLASRFERDFNDARESGRVEVERTRMSLETDIEAANHQVNVVRIELESDLVKVRAELENVKMEAETTKARHERHLEDEDSARRETLRKVNHASSVALDDVRQKHESTLHELRSAHDRALNHALEDKQRSEYFLNEKLALSDSKLQHFQDRVLHLEERLEVAKSAAQAAATSAQSKAVPSQTRGVPVASSTAVLPEKISPQALRESILVLQEQLQERESRIDQLQNQVESDGPLELKKRDDEIAWLREVLAVRGEELTDLVNTLAQPTYDRAHVRDTAIRIRATLQMEQQEKERSNQNTGLLPTQAIASLSNFATPKAAQLSTAFQKWRANMESSALKNAPRGYARPRSNTPSKPSTSAGVPQGHTSGLMTPPASNLRSTPSPEASNSIPPQHLPSRSGKEKVAPSTEPPKLRSRVPSAASDAPTTPLFRSQSYDQDAEDHNVSMQSFEDEDLDIADNVPPAFRSLEDELDTAAEDDSVL